MYPWLKENTIMKAEARCISVKTINEGMYFITLVTRQGTPEVQKNCFKNSPENLEIFTIDSL